MSRDKIYSVNIRKNQGEKLIMNYAKSSKLNRVASIVLSVLMIFSMFPVTGFAAKASTVTTDIGKKTFTVGEMTEFTFRTTANDDGGESVVAELTFSDPTDIEKIEYYDTAEKKWFALEGDFGPADGYELADATNTVRAAFKTTGRKTLTIEIISVADKRVLCSTVQNFEVAKHSSVLSSDISEKKFVVGVPTEFTFTTTANDDRGIMVVGSSDFGNSDAIEKFEYKEGENWYDLKGDFGPASGFPMSDAASIFRVTFKTAGKYSFNVFMKKVDGGDILCSLKSNITVLDMFDVNVSKNVGGSVFLNNNEVNGISVEENSKVSVKVVAATGYRIRSIFIGGAEQRIENEYTFSSDVDIAADTEVKAEFEKLYTVTVQYDSKSGSVTTDPSSVGGEVKVTMGEKVTITATPGVNFRVAKVEITDRADEVFDGNDHDINSPFSTELTVDRDYSVKVTFAPLIFKMSVNAPENGNVFVNVNKVVYDGSAKIDITPRPGYTVASVLINGDDYYDKLEENADNENNLYISLEKITEDKDIIVSFKKIEKAAIENFRWNKDAALRSVDGNKYVFAKSTAVEFSTEKQGIRLTFDDGTVLGGKDTAKIEISSNRTVKSIQLRYDHAWHEVDFGSEETNIKILFDEVAPTVKADPKNKANGNGYYNADVEIEISANDSENGSGLKSVEYWIVNGAEETARGMLYTSETASDDKTDYKENITVNAEDNNSDNVTVYVKAVDKAGIESDIIELPLKICTSAVSAKVSFDDAQTADAVDSWYNFQRQATITIIDREDVFDENAATKGIVFENGSCNGFEVNWSSNGDEHIGEITFTDEGSYSWTYSYTNKADNTAKVTSSGDNVFEFGIDMTAPTGKILAAKHAESGSWEAFWEKLLDKLTFGLFANNEVTVALEGNKGSDDISGYQSVSYYKSNANKVLSETELDALYENNEFSAETVTVSAEEKFAVYARILDNAGNIKYIGTDGVIYDKTVSVVTLNVDDSQKTESSIYGVNNMKNYAVGEKTVNGIKVNVGVKDADADTDIYSGIKKVEYVITANGQETQRGILFDGSAAEDGALVREWNGEVIIDAVKNNSKKITLKVTVTDNAENEASKYITLKEINIDDITAEISVSGSARTFENRYGWYNESRTAEITIVDRASCFDEENATDAIKISAYNMKNEAVSLSEDDAVKIGEWKHNGDRHTVSVSFNAEGRYTLGINYTDAAGNVLANENISSNEDESPFAFTVDKSNPSGTVSVGGKTWTDVLLSVFTFGLYSKNAVDINVTGEDIFSPVKTEYYKCNATDALTYTELNGLYENGDFIKEIPTVGVNEQFAIYARVTDYSGNFVYIGSDGYVIDDSVKDLKIEAVDKPNDNKIYGNAETETYTIGGTAVKGIKVSIDAKDAEHESDVYSGIKKVSYTVTADRDGNTETTQSGTLFEFPYSPADYGKEDVSVPKKSDLCMNWAGCIVVDAEKNNGSKATVAVTVIDNAGNEITETLAMDIDITAPAITVEYNNNSCMKKKYFSGMREAKVTYKESAAHFDRTKAQDGITINAVDANGHAVEDAYTITWEPTSEKDTFVAVISYLKDANYEFSVSYTDEAGNTNETVNVGTSKAPYEFTIDTTPPTASLTVDSYVWTKLLNKISFGLYSNEESVVSAVYADATSPITAGYYISESETPLSMEELSRVTFMEYTDPITIPENSRVVVYLKVTDYAGNPVFVNTDGYIVDSEKSDIKIEIDASANENGIFGKQNLGKYTVDGKEITGIKLNVDVNEDVNENSGIYSGIAEIKYEVVAKFGGEDITTQSGVLYSFKYDRDTGENSNGGTLTVADVNSTSEIKAGEGVPSEKDLCKHWNGDIIVDAAKNNSCNVTLKVTVTDNAGNVVPSEKTFDIDTDAPKIKVSYDNNAFVNGSFFNEKRTATVAITERKDHFNSEAATEGINITAKDRKGVDVKDAYKISGWTGKPDSIDPDKYVYTAEIEYKEDANYTFAMSYVGLSGNSAEEIVYANTDAPTDKFTVDKTRPDGKVTVNDNVWSKLLDIITFGLFNQSKADVSIDAFDATSDTVIEYYKTNDPIAIAENVLAEKIFTSYEGSFSVNSHEQIVIYAKLSDMAGNVRYISSDGYIVDPDKAEIKLTPDLPNENGLYNRNVNVRIDVSDVQSAENLSIVPYSGIAKIEYWLTCEKDGITVENDRKTLYSFDYKRENKENSNGGAITEIDWSTGEEVVTTQDGQVPIKSRLKSSWSGTVTVDAVKNNSCNVIVHVGVTDNAGNYNEAEQKLDIDVSVPTVSVSYDGTSNDGAVENYFTSRTATVVITERNHHFDAKQATESIRITADGVDGQKYTIGEWKTETEGLADDMARHTAVIVFDGDANYNVDISYKDKAGNSASVFNDAFCVDKTAPVGTVTAESTEGRTETWSSLVGSLTYGFWSNTKISVFGAYSDATSPIKSVEYYMVVSKDASDSTTAFDKTQLDGIPSDDWKPFNGIDVAANNQFVVYLRITDYAGNYSYIGTNGLIVDDQHPVEESVAPEISVSPEKPINGIYSGDVKVSVVVDDPMVGGTYSGLKEVKYKIFDRDGKNPNAATQEGTLFSFNNTNPKQTDLVKTWKGEITVRADLNNSNNIQIVVYAVDNSLNATDNSQKESKGYAVIKIDTTAPVIDISYDNNNADSGSYFRSDRVATIRVTERNFNAADVKVAITGSDGFVPSVVGWKEKKGTYNGDDTVHEATLSYSKDGDYTFSIECSDLAGNVCKSVNYGESVSPVSFTVDKTLPAVTVAYDNNSSVNGNYFKAARIATVTVSEHNFSADRVSIIMTASDDGKNISVPTVSDWTKDGDKHIAVIKYVDDAKYSFDIAVKDLAGNEMPDYAAETFVVDKTAPSVEITGVADNSANNGEVVPVITFFDTNYDDSRVSITLTGANRKEVKPVGTYSEIHNGKVFTFADFAREKEIDDIYSLSVNVTDKAGNSTVKSISFSVNRFGSTYSMSENTEAINNTYAKQEQDIVITEVNTNELSNIKITLFKNNETIVLKSGTDFTVDVSGGNGAWYRYVYTIAKANFVDDGVYRIVIHSEDAAGNVSENTIDTKDFEINFGIDKTLPIVNINNLSDNTTYAVDKLTVNMSVNDNLKLSQIFVYLDGKEYKRWAGDELETAIAAGGSFDFDIPGDSTNAHSVKISAVDAAGNEQIQEINNFFVTTNLWVRYYNNKTALYGSVGGVVLLTATIIVLVVLKRKKNEKK